MDQIYIKEKELEDIDKLDKVVSEILEGNIVALPTDTVYGVGCILKYDSIEKLYDIKQRNKNKPICVLAANLEQVKTLSKNLTNIEKNIFEKVMPGSLTLIVEKGENIPNNLVVDDTIGIRIPKRKEILKLLEKTGPLATTSANLSGQKSFQKCKDIQEFFKDKIGIYIDGRVSTKNMPSTIIKVKENLEIEVIRKGLISKEEILYKIHN